MKLRRSHTVLMAMVLLSSTTVYALQDPTRPPGAEAPGLQRAAPRDIRVGSILLGPNRRVAVINGVAMREGESHDGLKVRRIHRDKIEVVDQGRPRVLYPESLPQVRRTQ